MKKLLLLLLCLSAALSVNAQGMQNGDHSNVDSSGQTEVEKGFNKLQYISSDPSFKYSTKTSHGVERGSDKGHISGIVYTRSQYIASAPLYLEFGGGFVKTSFEELMYSDDVNLKLYSLYFPLNVSYRFSEADKLYGSFFTGPYMKYNFAGSLMGETDIFVSGGAKRAQLGWQIGADVSYDGWYLSFSFIGDSTNLLDFSATGFNVKNRVSGVLIGFGGTF